MKILIADDESIIRMGLKSMLQELGHTVFAARDGRDALDQARRYNPDLAILDIQMPKTNGLQAAKAMHRANPIPIILLTANSDAEMIEQASELPIQAYLVKPVRGSAELAATIAVSTKRFQDQQAEAAQRAKAEQRLETRILLDRAKAILIKNGLSETDAFAAIQKQSRDERRTMRDVALKILADAR